MSELEGVFQFGAVAWYGSKMDQGIPTVGFYSLFGDDPALESFIFKGIPMNLVACLHCRSEQLVMLAPSVAKFDFERLPAADPLTSPSRLLHIFYDLQRSPDGLCASTRPGPVCAPCEERDE